MMFEQILLWILSTIFGAGVAWGITHQKLKILCSEIQKLNAKIEKIESYELNCAKLRETCRCEREEALEVLAIKRENLSSMLSVRIERVEGKLNSMAEDLSFIRGRMEA